MLYVVCASVSEIMIQMTMSVEAKLLTIFLGFREPLGQLVLGFGPTVIARGDHCELQFKDCGRIDDNR